jgi:hypothetical protein
MPLLRVESKGKPHTIKAQLDGNTANDLKLYARFAGDTTIDAVIKAALTHAFDQDKEFQAWKTNPDNVKEPERGQRKKSEPKTAGASAVPHHDAAKLAAK